MTFVATKNTGFAMTFDNGFTISVQWGTINYCEKKNLGAAGDEEMKTDLEKQYVTNIIHIKMRI